MLGWEVTRRHGGAGLPDGTISLTFRGSAGQSFAAFVHDPFMMLPRRLNVEMVELEPLDEEDQRTVQELCRAHQAATGSQLAACLLDRWEQTVHEIVKVMPRDYRRVLEATRRAIEAGGSVDDEVMAAAHG